MNGPWAISERHNGGLIDEFEREINIGAPIAVQHTRTAAKVEGHTVRFARTGKQPVLPSLQRPVDRLFREV